MRAMQIVYSVDIKRVAKPKLQDNEHPFTNPPTTTLYCSDTTLTPCLVVNLASDFFKRDLALN